MSRNPSRDTDAITDHGFKWGPMEVTRCASFKHKGRRYYSLLIKTSTHEVEVMVSEYGYNAHVFRDDRELS